MKTGQLSQNFFRREFECRCGCGFDAVDAELVRALEDLRTKLGDRPVKILSGCRCRNRNIIVGGADSSKHLTGQAADFTVEGVEPAIVADCLEDLYPMAYGIGRYLTWTHLDVRHERARWKG